jgi:hypothetical protein
MDMVWGWRRGSCGSIDHVGGEECGRKEEPRKIKHHAGWGPQDIELNLKKLLDYST